MVDAGNQDEAGGLPLVVVLCGKRSGGQELDCAELVEEKDPGVFDARVAVSAATPAAAAADDDARCGAGRRASAEYAMGVALCGGPVEVAGRDGHHGQ